jgi:hypothetical protein
LQTFSSAAPHFRLHATCVVVFLFCFAMIVVVVVVAGPTPVLPDWAFGTWFTYWYSYTEAEAKDGMNRLCLSFAE